MIALIFFSHHLRPTLSGLAGAMERLRSFSSAKAKAAPSSMTPEQLKKQSTAKVRGLQHRHGELMKSLKEILAEVQSDSSWEGLKKDQATGSTMGTATAEVETPPQLEAPVTLWRPESSKVKVLHMNGPAAKLNSRLRRPVQFCGVLWVGHVWDLLGLRFCKAKRLRFPRYPSQITSNGHLRLWFRWRETWWLYSREGAQRQLSPDASKLPR